VPRELTLPERAGQSADMRRTTLGVAIAATLLFGCGNDKGTGQPTSSSADGNTTSGSGTSGSNTNGTATTTNPGDSNAASGSATASGAQPNSAESSAQNPNTPLAPADTMSGGNANAGSANTGSANTGSAGMGSSGTGSASTGAAGADTSGAAPGGAASGVGPITPKSGTLRILAVGDSITRATCWRAALWNELNQNFSGRFDFVGTLTSDNGCSPGGYDEDNQGYSSSLVTEIVAGITNARTCDPTCPTLADLTQAFATAQPDVLLMHFGTNDVWNAKPTDSIISAYTSVIGAARAANPNVVILAAQLIPMNVTATTCSGCSCANCVTDIPALNQRITSWASTNGTAQSPIVVVDQYTGYDAVADSRDGVHPNNGSGSTKMADRWYAALAPLFGP
jgi:lysophospholipase L1-like esterase